MAPPTTGTQAVSSPLPSFLLVTSGAPPPLPCLLPSPLLEQRWSPVESTSMAHLACLLHLASRSPAVLT